MMKTDLLEAKLEPVQGQPARIVGKWRVALLLAAITIAYNLIEGIVSMYFGAAEEMLTLFGFGMDSFAEVLSGVGIFHLVLRSRRSINVDSRDQFEKASLRITGISFYVLAAGLVAGAGISMWTGHKPDSSLPGLIIAGLSIATMYFLYRAKMRTGTALGSAAIIADARCTLSCLYLSYILLGASAIYSLFQIPYIDAIGSLGLAFYVVKEGRETFAQARRGACMDHCC